MNKTNKTNFKAFQTPSGIADPVRPNREPQPYPGSSLVKPNPNSKAPAEVSEEIPADGADETSANVSDETSANVSDETSANVSDETSANVSGEIPTKIPGEMPVKLSGEMPVSESESTSDSALDSTSDLGSDLRSNLESNSKSASVSADSDSNTASTPSQNTHQKFMFLRNADGVIDEEDDDPLFPDVYGDEDDYKDDYRDENDDEYEADDDEYVENDIRSWFYTFMCMNIPIYGWIYLRRLATGKIPAPLEQQDFAEAYLYYKRFFLKISAVILIVLIIIGAIALNKLLAYMQML